MCCIFMIMWVNYTDAVRGANVGLECCIHFLKGPINFKHIMYWYRTPDDCSKDAIVFVTYNHGPMCANPRDRWVQRTMKRTKEQTLP